MSKLKERLAELSVERDLIGLTEEWNNKGKVKCTYNEFELLTNFLVDHETAFKVSFAEYGKIIIQR